MGPAVLLLAALGLVLFWWLLRNANELCRLRMTNGVCRVVRGRAPARFIEDVQDILVRARCDDATVRVVVESGEPRATFDRALTGSVQQQIRNALGLHRVATFRAGKGRVRSP